MATIPERECCLENIIISLYDNIDEMRIAFNGYENVPCWIKKYKKIKCFLYKDNRYEANAVWDMMNNINGYVFVCDDDILYPCDYIQKMMICLNKYNLKAAISVHGKKIKGNRTVMISGFSKEEKKDKVVDIVGVGVLLFHTNYLFPRLSDFHYKYCRDLQFSILSYKKDIPLVRIKSIKKWCKHYGIKGSANKIYIMVRNNSKLKKRRKKILNNIFIPLIKNKNSKT